MSAFHAGTFTALESLLNNTLGYDPATRQRLQPFDGKVVLVECSAPQQRIYVIFAGEHIELWNLYESSPDLGITGSAAALLKLWQLRDTSTALMHSGVSCTGDTLLLQQLQVLTANIDIDWEAILAEMTGDVVAHGIGKALRATQRWWMKSITEGQRLLGEYLREETDVLPHKHQLRRFCNDVDAVMLDTDRFAARTQELETRIGHLQERTAKKPIIKDRN